MVFGDDVTGNDTQLSRQKFFILVMLPTMIGLISVGFLIFLLFSTLWGDIRGTMKSSEKFLLYNVIAPDGVLAFYLISVICPATYTNNWKYNQFTTNWMGFLFTWSILHAPLAMASICSLIAMSYKDPNKYDNLNKESRMFLLSMGYTGVSCCLCSLPATEKKGFLYDHFWFHPTTTVFQGYGGIFTLLATSTLTLFITASSLYSLSQEKTAVLEKKVNRKYIEDLNTSYNFVGLCLTMSIFVPVPLVLPIDNHMFTLPLRCVIYLGPICRVLLLTRTCPHFQFVTSHDTDQALLSEFAQLSALN